MGKPPSSRAKVFAEYGKAFDNEAEAHWYGRFMRMQERGEVAMVHERPSFPYYHGRVKLWDYQPFLSYWKIDPHTGARLGRVVFDVLPAHYYFRPKDDPMLIAFMETNPDIEVVLKKYSAGGTTHYNHIQRRKAGFHRSLADLISEGPEV